MAATRVGDRNGAAVRVPFGRYALLQLLAATRLGGVHRAELGDGGTAGVVAGNVPLAIKWLKPERSRDADVAVAFMDVMSRARQVRNEAACTIFDVGRAPDGSLFAALEWVGGKDWKRIVASLRKEGKPMPPVLVAYVGIRIAEALEAAHQLTADGRPAPLYHGELSGADILIGYDGKVRLCGLGSGELSAAARLPHVRTAFRAPELAHGAPFSAQSDVFSLGACLYQALAITGGLSSEGSGTQVGDRPESLIRHVVPAALLELVQRAVAEDPRSRFASAGELGRALSHWASTQSSPGDAHALAEFMTTLFEQARSGPMNDAKEQTPAQPIRARKLAATMTPARKLEEPATLPTPVVPVSPVAARASARSAQPVAAVAEPEAVSEELEAAQIAAVAALAAPVAAETELVTTETETVAALSEPVTGSVAKSVAMAATAAAGTTAAQKSALDDDWEREPWETAAPTETPWSVAPAAPPVARSRKPIATPPGRMRAAVPMPRRPSQPAAPAVRPSLQAPPNAAQSAAQNAAPNAAPISQSFALPAPTFLAPEIEPGRAAWRLPVFVAGALVLVFGALFLLRSPSEKPAPVAAPAEELAAAPAPAAAPTPEPEPAAPVLEEPTAANDAVPEDAVAAEPVALTAAGAAVAPKRAAALVQPVAKTSDSAAPTRSERPRREATIAAADARGGAQYEPPVAQPTQAPVEEKPATAAYEAPVATAALEATSPAPTPAARPTTPTGTTSTSTTSPVASARPAVAKPAASAPKPAQVFAAAILEQTSPRFPPKAKRLDITEGKVSIDYTVDASGGVRDLRVVASSPRGIFDDAAIEALKQWRYRPKVVDGKPVESRLRFTFHFQ